MTVYLYLNQSHSLTIYEQTASKHHLTRQYEINNTLTLLDVSSITMMDFCQPQFTINQTCTGLYLQCNSFAPNLNNLNSAWSN